MSNFVDTPPFLTLLWVAIETMHFLIAQTDLFFGQFCIKGPLIKKIVLIKFYPRVQGKLSWPLDYL